MIGDFILRPPFRAVKVRDRWFVKNRANQVLATCDPGDGARNNARAVAMLMTHAYETGYKHSMTITDIWSLCVSIVAVYLQDRRKI